MARIAGVNVPDRQHTVIGLTAIYGIGRARAQAICAAVGIEPSKKVRDLSDAVIRLAVSSSRATCVAKSRCRSSA